MMIIVNEGAHFVVVHAGRVIDKVFATREEADRWADSNVDDQMFDGPNTLSPPLVYRIAPLMRVVGDELDAR